TDELWTIEWMTIDPAVALHANEAIRTIISNRAFHSGVDREFLGAEELLAFNFAINNPAIHVTFLLRIGDRNRLEIMVVLELCVDIPIPIQLLHNPIEVPVFAFRHIFDEQRPGNFATFNKRLIHAKDIAAPLRLIRA